jgi:hypothetical protein
MKICPALLPESAGLFCGTALFWWDSGGEAFILSAVAFTFLKKEHLR